MTSRLVSQRALADGFEVSARTVQQWDRDGLRDAARQQSSGREASYDVFAAARWLIERERARAVKATTADDELNAARLRKLEAEAESMELNLAEKRGEMVPLDEVEGLVRESLEAVDSVLRHSPSRFAPTLAKAAKVPIKSARAILRDVIESVRGAIREHGVRAKVTSEVADAG